MMLAVNFNWAIFENFDAAIFRFAESLKCAFLDYLMGVFTIIGEEGLVWIAFGIIMLFFKKTRKAGLVLIAAMGVTGVINSFILKDFIGRERPFVYEWTNGFLFNDEIFRPAFLSRPDSFSFPSGHAASSAAAVVVLWTYLKRDAGIPALILAFLIAFSRIYVHDHFPSDVLAGIIFGVLYGLIALLGGYILYELIIPAFEKKKRNKDFSL